jgi:hypothetical protein
MSPKRTHRLSTFLGEEPRQKEGSAGGRRPFKNITTLVIVMTELGASMPQFFVMGNSLKHYLCYIVSNLFWKYPPSFVNVTLLVIYSSTTGFMRYLLILCRGLETIGSG